jgi:translation initiation factor 3 subunit A
VGYLQVRIDHKSKSLQFGGDLYVAQKDDIREGPQIQSLTSEQIRYQLSQMASALKKASDILRPKSDIVCMAKFCLL